MYVFWTIFGVVVYLSILMILYGVLSAKGVEDTALFLLLIFLPLVIIAIPFASLSMWVEKLVKRRMDKKQMMEE